MEHSTEKDIIIFKSHLPDIYNKTYIIEWTVSIQEVATRTGEDQVYTNNYMGGISAIEVHVVLLLFA